MRSTTTSVLNFDTSAYKGTVTINTGLYINGEFEEPVEKGTVDVTNPANGTVICAVSAATAADIDRAVDAAEIAYKTVWGSKVTGAERGILLNKLADLVEKHKEELAALEATNVGKIFSSAHGDVTGVVEVLRYYAGWADKICGKALEGNGKVWGYTKHEPIGVVGQIIPWNLPLAMLSWKIGPALATGNTVVLKPSEVTPLTALRIAPLIAEAGFPPGVVNILTGYGPLAGQAIAEHPRIRKVAFTGSTAVGRKIMAASASSNLKQVTLELGGKSPNIVFDDADLDQAVKWADHGIFYNVGQLCCAGSRIFVQEGIYDQFLEAFTAAATKRKIGEPLDLTIEHGPQVSKVHFDRVMSYIESGKKDGATVHFGGSQHGQEGYFIQPTIFTNVKPSMKIVREEIFGPVGVLIKFRDEADVIKLANDTEYGLGAAVFTKDLNRMIRVSDALEAGTVWVNCTNTLTVLFPFGGFKQSGIGRELGEYALEHYTEIKSVMINTGMTL